MPKIQTEKHDVGHKTTTMVDPRGAVGEEDVDVERLEKGHATVIEVFVDRFCTHLVLIFLDK